MTTTTTQKPTNPFAKFDMSKSVANTLDLQKEAGPMQSASGVTVSDNMLASKQLGAILAKDNPLFVQARTRAQEAAAARGLANSSIAVGAGESAMIDAAMPLAQQDAGTYYDAAKFSAAEANNFARDANAFSRQGALAKYNNLFDAEQRGHDREFNAWESNTNRDFQASENLFDRTARADEAAASRALQERIQQLQEQGADRRQAEQIAAQERDAAAGREFTAGQNLAGQKFQADQNLASQKFQAEQNLANQAFTAEQNRLQNEFNKTLQTSQVPQQMLANFTNQMQGQIGAIMSDPNMTAEQKNSALQNYYSYANSQMTWMASMYGTDMPNMQTGGVIKAPGAAPAPAPAQAPAPAPAAAPAPAPQPTVPPPDIFANKPIESMTYEDWLAATGRIQHQ